MQTTPADLVMISFDSPAAARDHAWFRANPDAYWYVRPQFRDECPDARTYRMSGRVLVVRLPDSPRYPWHDRILWRLLLPGDDPATIAEHLRGLTDAEMYGTVSAGRVPMVRVVEGGGRGH